MVRLGSRFVLLFLVSSAVAVVNYVTSLAIGNLILDSLHTSHTDLIVLNKNISVIIALLSFLLVHSFGQTLDQRGVPLHSADRVVTTIVICAILAISLFMFGHTLSQVFTKSAERWEQMPVNLSQFVSYDFVESLQTDASEDCDNCELMRLDRFTIDGDRKPVLYMHPALQTSFHLVVPPGSYLSFSIALSPAVWHIGFGDGVQFDIYVDDSHTRQHPFSRYIDPKNIPADRRWHDYEIDLSPWAGKMVALTFSTGCGPNGNCNYDWAGWGEPRIVQPIVYDFLAQLSQASITLGEFGQVRTGTQTIHSETRSILLQHPTSRASFTVALPQRSTLRFGFGVAPEVWSQRGDGVEYNIYVRDPDEVNTLYQIFGRYCDPKHAPDDRRWFDERVDLSRFGNRTVEIIFETLPGPAGDSDYDWGGWSEPVLIDETLPGPVDRRASGASPVGP
jgi:hypothetical protein